MPQTKKAEMSNDNLSENLKELAEISNWFDAQEEIDIENGLEKVKRASELIKASKNRLTAIENQFHEIKRDIDGETDNSKSEFTDDSVDNPLNNKDEEVNIADIPF